METNTMAYHCTNVDIVGKQLFAGSEGVFGRGVYATTESPNKTYGKFVHQFNINPSDWIRIGNTTNLVGPVWVDYSSGVAINKTRKTIYWFKFFKRIWLD